MTVLQRAGRITVVAALACFAAFAQSTMTLDKLSYEATLPFTQIGVAGIPEIPANVAQSIQGGALEVRQSVEYVRATSMLHVRHFLVAPGSPNPTPTAGAATPVEDYFVAVSSVQQNASPTSVVIMGNIERLNVSSPFGRTQNAPFLLSIGYERPTTGQTIRFNNATVVLPGLMTTYIASATGTLNFMTTPGTGPGGQNGVVADAGADLTTSQPEITLDGSKSSATSGTLKYSWRVLQGAANLIEPTTAKPRVQFASNFGTYVFELTVTDAAGKSATDTVSVNYSGRF